MAVDSGMSLSFLSHRKKAPTVLGGLKGTNGMASDTTGSNNKINNTIKTTMTSGAFAEMFAKQAASTNDHKAPRTASNSIDDDSEHGSRIDCVLSPISLGTGLLSPDGSVVQSFVATPRPSLSLSSSNNNNNKNKGAFFDSKAVKFLRHSASFLRTSDLDLDLSLGDIPNFDHQSNHPPHSETMTDELWVALDDGVQHCETPMSQRAIHALARFGLQTATDQTFWSPDPKTAVQLQHDCNNNNSWKGHTFEIGTVPPQLTITNDILVWTGQFQHRYYGCHLPCVRSAAILQFSANQLHQLLTDSARVAEYNKSSTGRTDLVVFDPHVFGGMTKIMRSENKVLGKTLQFTTVLHSKLISDDGNTHLIVTRAVYSNANKLSSEILLGVNIIRPVDDSTCLLVSVNHVKSPIPLMIAKRIGLQAAANFIHDLRKCC